MVDATPASRNFNYYDWDPEFFKNNSVVEYLWIDGSGKNIRGKTRVIVGKVVQSVEDLEWWTYDGSSTGQAVTNDSEIWVKPVFLCKDPFRKYGWLALCEGYLSDKTTPAVGNFRQVADKVMKESAASDPWFGIEQEYFLFVRQGTSHRWPLGWPEGGFPFPQGQYYCSAGDSNAFGRTIAEAHLRLCISAGIKIAGLNAEVAPGQWEYQIGITRGIEAGDHMWIARYILIRLGEEFGLDVVFEPKPIRGDWNGSGCHTNYSTKETREEGGLKVILENHMTKLKEKHLEHVFVYGEGNKYRLTGTHETSSMDVFSYGTGNRACSVRIPVGTQADGKGYYEDRRPASNIDAYLVTAIIADTTLLNSKYCADIVKQYKDFRKRLRMEE